ncbi:bifunctional glycosyltransferase/class I SAM-dependent methyltransferase [Azohydromonas lata]|uniref:Bifunctional glycosyltransferase/class I SAM-dependent methyltransferase n=1 Tax=Azohydromonas lata TaxID=45677 RepID=A0ABU5IP03_9BURK|nr:bifunctional glycosyltransferase/class I SAM-dependent methyltransferase [Azohydromonas lata]MDZ5460620.1 bifunctional glycosyltransferase/class I SAM-dependent methyltransferase [Azohydromonas lata]
MNAHQIPIVTVSYNSPELILGLLSSLRQFYPNPVYVIDGSSAEHQPKIREVAEQFEGVQFIGFDYNIHHGPGMAWAIQNLPLQGPTLILDSDIVVLRDGFVEALQEELQPDDYGVGMVSHVNEDGIVVEYSEGMTPYLHPPCMLCNVEVMRQWPMPIKHGAPMMDAMRAMRDAGESTRLLRNVDWVRNDLTDGSTKIFLNHIGRGTVVATGGYHLEEWMAGLIAKHTKKKASGTAAAPKGGYNTELLRLMPGGARRIVEVGCSTGVLAQAYRALNPECDYWGLELNPTAAGIARGHCDRVMALDIETMADSDWDTLRERDCWVFGDVLEHLRYPWRVLSRVRQMLPSGGCIVISVPNAQHWSVQARLAVGSFRYEDQGLMNRGNLRWFTRVTLLEMLQQAGLRMEAGVPRIFDEPGRQAVMPAIRQMAQAMGVSPNDAERDALALQYVVRAVPA